MDTGEGFVVRVNDVPTHVPTHHRWYRDEETDFGEDGLGLNLYMRIMLNYEIEGFLATREGRVMSLMAVEAREQSEELKGMTWEEGVQWALDNSVLIRKVMEDGNPFNITTELNMNRWSCHLAHGKIYRAERY